MIKEIHPEEEEEEEQDAASECSSESINVGPSFVRVSEAKKIAAGAPAISFILTACRLLRPVGYLPLGKRRNHKENISQSALLFFLGENRATRK